MKNTAFLLGIFLLFIAALFGMADAGRELLEDNFSYTVLFEGDQSHGNGFYLRKNNSIFFVTARQVLFHDVNFAPLSNTVGLGIPRDLNHVLFYDFKHENLGFKGVMSEARYEEILKLVPDNFEYIAAIGSLYIDSQKISLKSFSARLLSYSNDIADPGPVVIEMELPEFYGRDRVRYHSSYDVAAVEIGTMDQSGMMTLYPEAVLKQGKVPGYLDLLKIKFFKEVLVGNDAFVFGYPASVAENNPLLDINSPLLRKGIIAGKNNRMKLLLIDAPRYHENSGGLVLEVGREGDGTDYKAVGMVTTVPFSNSVQSEGYGIAVPMDMVLEILR